MKIPEPTSSIVARIDRWHEDNAASPFRPHLGCSLIGHPCDRWLWLSFRWAVRPQFEGRVLRLFRRGQNEEAVIVSDLLAIGIDIRHTSEDQLRVDLGAHVGGSVDGVIESGLPEAPNKQHVAEFKTHSKKSFDDLDRQGVEKSKPQHWCQMQLYMHGLQIDRALYVAVCKDDDRLYTERVTYDKESAEQLVARGRRITLSDRMPEPLSADPTWYQCKYCDGHDLCHGSKLTREVNCRTCAHSTAKPDSTWRCERHDADGIPDEYQRDGCEAHVLHPDLVPWQINADLSTEWEAVYLIEGYAVRNGEGDAFTYSSAEIIANPAACADPNVKSFRAELGAREV